MSSHNPGFISQKDVDVSLCTLTAVLAMGLILIFFKPEDIIAEIE